jgi:hypothetical protein
MMGLMTMQMTSQQARAEEWRQQQEFERQAHERRIEEIREARGDTPKPSGPSPEIEALKLQMEFYKDTLKENQALIKEMATASKGTNPDDSLRKEIIDLNMKLLENQKTEMKQQYANLETRLTEASRFNLNVHDMVKQANAAGANLHVGDSTDLQVQNEHEYKMRQLEIQENRVANELSTRQAEATARAAEASRQIETVKLIATQLGSALVQSRMNDKKELKTSSAPVQTIAGAIQ